MFVLGCESGIAQQMRRGSTAGQGSAFAYTQTEERGCSGKSSIGDSKNPRRLQKAASYSLVLLGP